MRNFNWRIWPACVVLVLITGFFKVSYAQQKFAKTAFYSVMDTSDVNELDNEIAIVKASSLTNKDGYEGALLMRKADKVKGAKKKLDLFKEGRIKLGTAIQAEPDNTEFRFLRLAIEENAPKIVRYHSDIDKDKLLIQKNFKSLAPPVQHAILLYCKKSKVLHAEDF